MTVQADVPTDATAPASRSTAERIARRILLVENAAPRALLPMKGSLVLSAIRCVITYAIIPAMAPVIANIGILATPLSLTLSVVAAGMALVSLRRVWLADWSGRWGYTVFALVVLVVLAITIVVDLRVLFG